MEGKEFKIEEGEIMKSKNMKIKNLIYLPYECSAVEEYLEQMAEKGWLLESIKGSSFKFKKTELE